MNLDKLPMIKTSKAAIKILSLIYFGNRLVKLGGLIGNILPNGINSNGVTFNCNSLVTNGKPYTKDKYAKKYQFKVVDGYK